MAIPQGPPFIRRARRAGMRCALISNNAGPDRESYAEKCKKLGLELSPQDIFSVNALAGPYIAKHYADKEVLVIGSDMLVASMRKHAQVISADAWLTGFGMLGQPASPDDLHHLVRASFDAVVIGIDVNVNYMKLALATVAVQKGAKLIGANPDYSFPFEDGVVLPGNGSMVDLVAKISGAKPEYLGKPSLHMLEQIEEETGIKRDEMLIVGDRVETDIEFATRAGMPAYLVMTGVERDPEAVNGMENVKVITDLSELEKELEL